jgi:hypothetical protein
VWVSGVTKFPAGDHVSSTPPVLLLWLGIFLYELLRYLKFNPGQAVHADEILHIGRNGKKEELNSD